MPTPKPIKLGPRTLLRDTVTEAIQEAILDGTFKSGEVLREPDLIEWLGVSKAPIRDALAYLARIGLVETQPNKFTKVSEIHLRQIIEGLIATGVLHELALVTAIPNLTASDIAELEKQLQSLENSVRNAERLGASRAMSRFLEVLDVASGNEVLVQMVRDLNPSLQRILSPRDTLPELVELTGPFRGILEGARNKDLATCVAALKLIYAGPRATFVQLTSAGVPQS